MFVLGIPTDTVSVKSLGGPQFAKPIAQIALLGSQEQMQWNQGQEELTIHKPSEFPSEHVAAFKVTFK